MKSLQNILLVLFGLMVFGISVVRTQEKMIYAFTTSEEEKGYPIEAGLGWENWDDPGNIGHFMKAGREKIKIWMTFDENERWELKTEIAEGRMEETKALSEKGKTSAAIKLAMKTEKLVMNIYEEGEGRKSEEVIRLAQMMEYLIEEIAQESSDSEKAVLGDLKEEMIFVRKQLEGGI